MLRTRICSLVLAGIGLQAWAFPLQEKNNETAIVIPAAANGSSNLDGHRWRYQPHLTTFIARTEDSWVTDTQGHEYRIGRMLQMSTCRKDRQTPAMEINDLYPCALWFGYLGIGQFNAVRFNAWMPRGSGSVVWHDSMVRTNVPWLLMPASWPPSPTTLPIAEELLRGSDVTGPLEMITYSGATSPAHEDRPRWTFDVSDEAHVTKHYQVYIDNGQVQERVISDSLASIEQAPSLNSSDPVLDGNMTALISTASTGVQTS